MEQAIHSTEVVPEHTVEIVVHISETLEEPQRNNLVVALENDNRIVAVTFCPKRCHLMLVKYDRGESCAKGPPEGLDAGQIVRMTSSGPELLGAGQRAVQPHQQSPGLRLSRCGS